MKITKEELIRAKTSIQSLIDIDSFFEEWDNVKMWKAELEKAEAMLATGAEIFEIWPFPNRERFLFFPKPALSNGRQGKFTF